MPQDSDFPILPLPNQLSTIEPVMQEGPAWPSIAADMPTATKINVYTVLSNGTQAPLGAIPLFYTVDQVIQRFPTVMPKSQDEIVELVGIPVDVAGRQMSHLSRPLTITGKHPGLNLQSAQVKPSSSIEQTAMELMAEQVRALSEKVSLLTERFLDRAEEIASARVENAKMLALDVSEGHTKVLDQALELGRSNREATASQATASIEAVKNLYSSFSQTQAFEAQQRREEDKRAHELALAQVKASNELEMKRLEIKEKELIDRSDRERRADQARDDERHRDHEASLERQEKAGVALLNSFRESEEKVYAIRLEALNAVALSQDKLAMEREKLQTSARGPADVVLSSLAAGAAAIGITPAVVGPKVVELAKGLFGKLTESGGAGIGTTIVTSLAELGKEALKTRREEIRLNAGREQIEEEEEEEEENEETPVERPPQVSRPQPVPLASPVPTKQIAPPAPVMPSFWEPQMPDPHLQARKDLSALVERLENQPQAALLPAILAELGAKPYLGDYFKAKTVEGALVEVGVEPERVKEVCTLVASFVPQYTWFPK